MAIILLVDDDPMVQSVTRELLQVSGYEVLGAENGADALKIMKNSAQRIDLVLLDLSLPDMDGMRLLKQIDQLRPQSPIIVCTGSLQENESDLRTDPAVKMVLQKPFNLRTLQEAVRSVLID